MILNEGRTKEAKETAIAYYVYTITIGIIMMICITVWRSDIIYIFTELEDLHYLLSNCLLIYLIDCIPELLFLGTASLLRINGFNHYAQFCYSVFFPVYGIISAPIFCFLFNLKTYGLVLSFSTGKLLVLIFAAYKLFSSEWLYKEPARFQ